jgi:hypothetical protein
MAMLYLHIDAIYEVARTAFSSTRPWNAPCPDWLGYSAVTINLFLRRAPQSSGCKSYSDQPDLIKKPQRSDA